MHVDPDVLGVVNTVTAVIHREYPSSDVNTIEMFIDDLRQN